MAINSASPGPSTAGPLPVVQARSVAARVSPRRRLAAPMGGAPGANRSARQHPLGGDLAEDAQCAADVLVVDESIGERDPAAEKGGQSGRVQVMPRPGEQVLRAVASVGGLWGARSRS